MNEYLSMVFEFIDSFLVWIIEVPLHVVWIIGCAALLSIVGIFLHVLPYKNYPKNFKVELFSASISALKRFFIILIAFLMISVLFSVSSVLYGWVSRMSRLQELQIVYKNISKDYLLADVSVLERSLEDSFFIAKIDYYSVDDYKKAVFSEVVKLDGSDIYVDFIQYNFEYSLIESGEKHNIGIPYRIFSNKISAQDGIALHAKNENGIPFIFERNQENVYGIDNSDYKKRLSELMIILDNPMLSQKEGILRSSSGSAVHFPAIEGKTYRIFISQIGGITVSEKADWL